MRMPVVSERFPMNLSISFTALFSIALIQVAAHRCVLRDTPNESPTTLPDSRINDDYCDCLDGSDEFRTSACPNGTFICANLAYREKKIPASWVGDGSCDCCDGSDEAPGRCSDNCAVIRIKEMTDAKQQADKVLRGVATRESYVKQVASAIRNDARELREVERELVTIERAVGKSKATADGLRKMRDWQHRPSVATPSESVSDSAKEQVSSDHKDAFDDDDDYHYEDEGDEMDDTTEGEKIEEGENEGTESEEQEHDEAFDDVEEIDDYAHERQVEGDKKVDEEDHIDDSYKDDELETTPENKPELNGLTGSETEGGTAQTASESELEKEAEDSREQTLDVDSVCADLHSSGSNPAFRVVSYFRAVVLAKLHRLLPRIFRLQSGSAIGSLDECIRKADSAKWKLESRKSDIEEKIKKLKSKQTTDYGPDKALRKLHGECIKTKVMQYEFEHCPFDRVRQYEYGSVIASLGRFDGWENMGDERVLRYSNGDVCWNGPARSTKVKLVCGETEGIISVDEPNRCTYFMKFQTPAVCEKEMAEKIMAPFNTKSEIKEDL